MSDATLRVGLIGAGGIAAAHVDAWLAHGADVRVFSRSGATAFAARHNIAAVDTIDRLWGWSDAIDIVSPTPTHADFALAAIANGVPVVCEKPLARTAAQAQTILAAAQDAGVMLFPAHVVRYFPQYAAARDAVHGGQIGELTRCRFTRQSAAPKADWFFDEAMSGGILMDQMIHDLDQAEWIAGSVVSVSAEATTDFAALRVGSAEVTLQHASGAVSTVHGRWGEASLPFSSAFELTGSAGVLRHDSAAAAATPAAPAAARRDDVGGYLADYAPAESPFTLQIGDVIATLRGAHTPRVTAADGVRAVELVEAAARSVATGKPVSVPPRL